MGKHKDTRIKIRKTWGNINPVTKIKHSRKAYDRIESKIDLEEEMRESECIEYEYDE